MYETKCPHCGKEELYVVGFRASTMIPLSKDGFSTTDAKFMDTSDEIVLCSSCNQTFYLTTIM